MAGAVGIEPMLCMCNDVSELVFSRFNAKDANEVKIKIQIAAKKSTENEKVQKAQIPNLLKENIKTLVSESFVAAGFRSRLAPPNPGCIE